MGLLDEAKEKASKYISPKDFLCFISYKRGEPIGEVASFLLYNNFDELVCEYHIDDHYRVCEPNGYGNNFRTIKLFNEINKYGFTDYIMFCNQFYDDCLDGDEPYLDPHDPTPIDINFFYSLEELQQMSFIQELELPLEEASTLDYTVYNDDMVKAKKSKDERMFKLIDLQSQVSVQDIKPSIKDNTYQPQANIFEAIITDKILAPTVTQTEPKNDKERIAELESKITELTIQLEQQAAAPANESLLQTILDESREDHAPDLKHAVQLWIDLYVHKKVGGNSHTGRADNWILKNTDYNAETTKADQRSIDRIREIATPLKDFGGRRSKEIKK